jgi:branched-chain amino acid transport system ATP-binding protein
MAGEALVLTNVKKAFGRSGIISGVNLRVMRGSRHAVIGPNGAGKSTLFNLITGRYRPDHGSILLNGREISGLAPFEINRRGLSRSFQVTNVFPTMSVFENLRCSLLWSQGYRYSWWHITERQVALREKTEKILEQINLVDRRDVPAGRLAYSEQRALEIGITIGSGASVILLDEPTQGMSHSETTYIVDLIQRVAEDKSLLLVEHDMSVVFSLADTISVLVYGKVIATGTPAEIRANPTVQEAYLGVAVEATRDA